MPPARECFVYIQLPGSVETVVCGRFVREATRDGRNVGRFVYGRSYRERPDAVALDPIHLPIAPTVYQTTKLDGVFGALRDAAPDAWGRRVIERIVGRHVDEVDFLLESPQDGAGALTFGRGPFPPAPVCEFNRVVQLEELRSAAALLEEDRPGEPLPAQILDLLDPGSSLGGAAVPGEHH
jgi:serine/threonine-protein kinase HipA